EQLDAYFSAILLVTDRLRTTRSTSNFKSAAVAAGKRDATVAPPSVCLRTAYSRRAASFSNSTSRVNRSSCPGSGRTRVGERVEHALSHTVGTVRPVEGPDRGERPRGFDA